MANTAAILDVIVKAQTAKAAVELKKFDKQLQQTSKSAKDTDRSFVESDKNVRRFGSSIGDTNQRMMLFKNTVGLVKFPAMIAGLGGAAQAAAAASAGVGGLVSALAPLSGLLAAYPALLGAFGQAMGVTAVAGLSDVTDAVGGLNEKLDETSDEFKNLSPQAQEFARSLQAAKAPLLDIQSTVQRPLFEGLNDGLAAATKNMPVLRDVAKDTASVMGDLAREAGRFAGREGFGKDFAQVGENNAQLLGRLGEAGMHFADAMRHVVVVSQPLIDFLGKGVVKLSEWIEEQAKAGRESGRMAEFFERTERVVRQLVSIGGSLASVFLDIGHAARPLGEDIMKVLVDQAQKLANWTDSNQGKLRAYFDDARGPLEEVGRLLKDVVSGFFELANTPGLSKLIKQFRTELLPVLIDMTRETTKSFGPVLIDALTQVVKLLSNFMGTSGPLNQFVELIGTAAEALNNLFDEIPALATAAASALAGFSIFKLLGLGSLLGQGSTIGTKLGERFGSSVGNAAGPVIAATIGSFLAGVKLSPKILANKDAILPMNASEGVEHLAEALDITVEHAQRLSNFMGNHPGFDTTESLKAMRQQAQHTINTIENFGNKWGLTTDEIRAETQKNFRAIRRTMGTESMQAKIAVMKNFDAAVDAIKNSMDAGEISAKQGAKMIHNVLIKQLKGYGIKDAEGFLNRSESVQASGGEGHRGLARGGPINIGAPSGDSVPAMLERGEYVLNRNAAAKLGRSTLDRINFGEAKRFQSGGMVDPAGPGTGVVNPAIADVVGAWSQHYNAAINYGYDPGGGHVSPGHNVTGTATDTSPAAGWTATATALFEKGLKAVLAQGLTVGYGTAGIGEAWPDHGRGNHAHIEWGMSPGNISGAGGFAGGQVKLPRFSSDFGLGLMVATGLNNVAAGTEKSVNARLAKMGAGVSGDIGPLGGGALSPAEFSALARQAIKLTAPQSEGFNVAGLLTLAMAESSLNPNSQNTTDINAQAGDPSGGLMQLTGTNFRAYHEPGTANNIFDPLANIAASINYQRDRYGSQVTHSPYMRGGFVEMAEGGPVWPEKLLGPNLPSVLQGISQDEGEALQGLMKRIRGAQPNAVSSDGELLGKLFDLRQMADQNLEWSGLAAQRDQDIPWDLEYNAGKWNIMNEKGKAIESFSSEAEAVAKYTEMIQPLLGLFHGHTEQFWRSSELDNLWSLRKRLILAARQMKERREQMHDALQIANERRRDWQHRVNDLDREGKTPKGWDGPDPVKGEIKDWNDQSDKKRAEQKRKFNRQGGKLPGDRAWNGDRLVAVGQGARRVLSALEEKIIPALETGEGRFNDARVSLLNEHLATVQGTGMSMRGLDNRPPVDELLNQFAGEINASAFRLQELRADPRFTDTTEEVEAPTWTIGQLLEFAQALRYGAFSQYGYAGEFAKGGFIPRGQYGLVGERGPEFMTGPAQITPAAPATATPMIFADVYIGGEKIDERVQAEITGRKNSDNLRLRARHVQR